MKKTRNKKQLSSCPNCGADSPEIWRTWTGGYPPTKFHVECPRCHWCGKTKRFSWRAKRAWNKEIKTIKEKRYAKLVS